jgi:hypothetical protein
MPYLQQNHGVHADVTLTGLQVAEQVVCHHTVTTGLSVVPLVQARVVLVL